MPVSAESRNTGHDSNPATLFEEKTHVCRTDPQTLPTDMSASYHRAPRSKATANNTICLDYGPPKQIYDITACVSDPAILWVFVVLLPEDFHGEQGPLEDNTPMNRNHKLHHLDIYPPTSDTELVQIPHP